ncbi:GvpL/GvpF family gas vesicle protein [Streptomyces sp. NPDC050504]|uniref:GvpL/GvpF family gas vesicle protein n=1 Tax=Streptomyces sp. NPDC050504 TaxID=3365618 RepID=UPI003789AD91
MNELRYVYAVTRPFEGVLPEGVEGLDGRPPRLVGHEGLVAAVSPVGAGDFDEIPLKAHLEDLGWVTATARTHQAVVAALATLTTPLPLRLATVCRDDSGVRRLVDSGREHFVRTLERLDGRVEWGVKVYVDEGPATAAAARVPGEPGRVPSGRDYLRGRRQERDARDDAWKRAVTAARQLHTELCRHAEDGVVHRPQDARLSAAPGRNVLNAAYLVERAHSEAFVERVEALHPASPAIRVELTGPWAPYSFTGQQAPR